MSEKKGKQSRPRETDSGHYQPSDSPRRPKQRPAPVECNREELEPLKPNGLALVLEQDTLAARLGLVTAIRNLMTYHSRDAISQAYKLERDWIERILR